ncbi:MAG: hypothetical protein FWF08_04055 [Oscillospiraceae bacterium]|nr:hypothetical protein [Oscillospiraceae bacterium]
MKNIAIISFSDAGTEAEALRQALEHLGYFIIMYRIGRPQDFIKIISGETGIHFDFMIISCHGRDGKIKLPVLGEDVYFGDEPRSDFGYTEINRYLKLKNTCIINSGCTTGDKAISEAFAKNGNKYIAPADYIEGSGAFVFTVLFFYYLSQEGYDIASAYKRARETDSETGLFAYF